MLQSLIPEVRGNWKVWLVGIVILIGLVMAFCWWLWTPAVPQPEKYAPSQRQPDRSLLLEKKPDPHAVAKNLLPPGATLKRLVSVTVQPRAVAETASPAPVETPLRQRLFPSAFGTVSTARPPAPSDVAKVARCPPVTVDLSLAALPDKSWRVVASSPDGEVVGGVDIPVEPVEPPPPPKLWAAGLAADPFRRTVGAFVDRDVGFLRLGAQINQRDMGDLPNQVWLKAGIRW